MNQKLAKIAKTLVEIEKGKVGIAGVILELDKKIDDTIQSVNQEVSTIKEIAENTAKQEGRNPLFVGSEPPSNPRIGDLWYQN